MEKSEKNEHVLRPVIKRSDEVIKLADRLKSTPSSIANYCVDVFLDVCNDAIPELENELKSRFKMFDLRNPR